MVMDPTPQQHGIEETKSWAGDLPGIPGADQTVWTVANDLPDEFTELLEFRLVCLKAVGALLQSVLKCRCLCGDMITHFPTRYPVCFSNVRA